jgi:hypothetical protein
MSEQPAWKFWKSKKELSANKSAEDDEQSRNDLQKINEQIQHILADLEKWKKEVEAISRRIDSMDKRALRVHALSSIQTSSISLFSQEAVQRQIALETLFEYSQAEDSVVRRECMNVLETIPEMEDYKPPLQGVIDCLRIVAKNDEEAAVRFAARQALKKFGLEP